MGVSRRCRDRAVVASPSSRRCACLAPFGLPSLTPPRLAALRAPLADSKARLWRAVELAALADRFRSSDLLGRCCAELIAFSEDSAPVMAWDRLRLQGGYP
jgi:hypothetical protein